MKKLFLILGVLASISLFAAADGTQRLKVLMVNELGEVNTSNLADSASVVSNTTNLANLSDRITTLETRYTELTNTVNEVVNVTTEGNLVIYRYMFVDSLYVDVYLSADATLKICGITPNITTYTSGGSSYSTHRLYFCCSEDIGTLIPVVRASETLGDGITKEDFEVVPEAMVTQPILTGDTWTDGEGNEYTYVYYIDVTCPSNAKYFYWIMVNPDTPDGDGATFNMVNGVTGGYTGQVQFTSDKKLIYVGGVLMEVQNVSE